MEINASVKAPEAEKAARLIFLGEVAEALDNMEPKLLVAHKLVDERGFCALGATARRRGFAVEDFEFLDEDEVPDWLGITPALADEVAKVNDLEAVDLTPEDRFLRVRRWIAEQLEAGA
jgi:hypothetical protein